MENLYAVVPFSSTQIEKDTTNIKVLPYLQIIPSKKCLFGLTKRRAATGDLWSLSLYACYQSTATGASFPVDLSHSFVQNLQIAEITEETLVSGFFYSEENDALIIALSSGDIIQVTCLYTDRDFKEKRQVFDSFGELEKIGIFKEGIHHMEPSPDGEVVCLLTTDSTQEVIVFMSLENWEVIKKQQIFQREQTVESNGKSFLLKEEKKPRVVLSSWNICWRADASFVAVTYPLDNSSKIQMQVFRREGFQWESTCEEVWETNGCCIGWQPRMGGAIAVAFPQDNVIRFYEANGLSLRRIYLNAGISCRQLEWTQDVDVLATNDSHRIRLFHHSNYHWYLKQELSYLEDVVAFRILQDNEYSGRKFIYVLFSNGMMQSGSFQWQFSNAMMKDEDCYVSSIDGKQVAITNFSLQIVPPPLCSVTLECQGIVNRIHSIPNKGWIFHLSDGRFEYFSLHDIEKSIYHQRQQITWTSGQQLENHLDMMQNRNNSHNNNNIQCQGMLLPIQLADRNTKVIIATEQGHWDASNVCVDDHLCLYLIVMGQEITTLQCYQVDSKSCWRRISDKEKNVPFSCLDAMPLFSYDARLNVVSSSLLVLFLLRDCLIVENISEGKEWWRFSLASIGLSTYHLVQLQYVWTNKESIGIHKDGLIFCFLDQYGKLWMTYALESEQSQCLLLSQDAVTFQLTTDFLFFVNRFHKSYTCSLSYLWTAWKEHLVVQKTSHISSLLVLDKEQTEERPVERFSKIIAFVRDHTGRRNNCLILQAPRGNLECIVPRPVIKKEIEQHIERREYKEAYRNASQCRRHRFPFDILIEKNPTEFKEHVLDFIQQVDDAEYLNTFISMLGVTKPTEIRNDWCEMLIDGFHRLVNIERYKYPLICAYLQKKPADILGALQVVQKEWRCRAATTETVHNIKLVEDMIDFVLLLTKDSDLVFQKALALYDLSLAAMVVERASNLDPAHYGFILQRLSAPNPERQKYLIDLELGKRNTKTFQTVLIEDNGLYLLGNWENALRHLFACSSLPKDADEVVQFAVKHELFHLACCLCSSYPETLAKIRTAYAYHLSQQGQHVMAARYFSMVKEETQAKEEYMKGQKWHLSIFLSRKILWQRCSSTLEERKDYPYTKKETMETKDDHFGLFYEDIRLLVNNLKLNAQKKEAADLLINYLNEPENALEQLIEAEDWFNVLEMTARFPIECFEEVLQQMVMPQLKNTVHERIEEWKEVANKMNYRRERLQQVQKNKESIMHLANSLEAADLQDDEQLSESDTSSQSTMRQVSFLFNGLSLAYRDSFSITSWGEWTMSSDTSKASLYSMLSKKNEKRKSKKHKRRGDPMEEGYLKEYLASLIPSYLQWEPMNQLMECLICLNMEKEARLVYEVMKLLLDAVTKLSEDIRGIMMIYFYFVMLTDAEKTL
eukprot:jgi/Galph1/580/GphlegSOOS_G5328.1